MARIRGQKRRPELAPASKWRAAYRYADGAPAVGYYNRGFRCANDKQ